MNGRNLKTQSKLQMDPADFYLQLYEIKYQLAYMGEAQLAIAVEERLEQLWSTLNAQDHKELTIRIYNLYK